MVSKMRNSSALLVNLRLVFFTAAFIHLVIAAAVIFSIDMSDDPDPRVSAYIFVRWRLITCWFNLISIAYMPICLYCEWKEKQGQADCPRVAATRKVRDLILTGILFPTTMFADTLFWRLWYKDKVLIAPVRVFDYLPDWAHHSLHTVSMLVVVLDLLLVPRRRPRSLLPGLALMVTFLTVYTAVLIWSYRNGAAVYSVFEMFETHKLLLLILYSYTECLFHYMSQWCIVDLVWGRRVPTEDTHLKVH